jgi:ABC-2 type transport system permease protein
MNKFNIVLGFHLKEGFASKSFRITTAILLAAILGFFAFTHFFGEDEKLTVSVANTSSKYDFNIEELNKTSHFAEFTSVGQNDIVPTKDEVKDGELDALIVISEKNAQPNVEYFFRRNPNFELLDLLKSQMQPQYLQQVITEKQVQPDVVTALLTPVAIKPIPLKESESTGLVYFFLFLIYMFIIMFGQQVSMSVAGEKTTRVMEIMITKVQPITMLYAKVISSMLVGITQIGMVALGYVIARLLGWTSDELTLFGMPLDLSVLNAKIFIFLAIYFALGYMIYALLFAAISSVISRIEDIGGIIFPISLLLMGAFFLGMKSMFNPNDTLVLVGSYIPFFSPIVTFSRIVLGEAYLLEIILSIVILLASILVIGLISNRIYLNGVMRYTSKTTIADVIKMAKGQS